MAWKEYVNTNGRSKYHDKFIVKVDKQANRIKLMGKSIRHFQNVKKIVFLTDGDEWAIKISEIENINSFAVQKEFAINCTGFIRDYNLIPGALYSGNIIDNMLVLSNIAFEFPVKKQVKK